MATRSDITVDFSTSPRIVTVQAPSTELTVQDLVDTLRVIEDDLVNMAEPRLLDAAGKENIGGGNQVGITTTLNDAQVFFESRDTKAETGTHTGSNDSAILVDSAADFVTANVVRGSLVVNFTDLSAGVVRDVIDANTLRLIDPGLFGGTDNDFDTGDAYGVWNVDQVAIRGGNLVAVDDVGGDINPTLPSVGTQVTRELSTSAALVSGSGLTQEQDERLILLEKIARNRLVTDPNTGVLTVYDDDGTTVFLTGQLYEDTAQTQTYRGQGAEERERLE